MLHHGISYICTVILVNLISVPIRMKESPPNHDLSSRARIELKDEKKKMIFSRNYGIYEFRIKMIPSKKLPLLL